MERQIFLRSDLELFEQIKFGDNQKALECLFDKYFRSLCVFAKTFLNTNDLAEEVVSDVFVKVWDKRKCLEVNTNVRAYLYRSVKNESLNQLKKDYWDFEDLSEQEYEISSEESNAEHMIMFEETSLAIDELINQMPPKRALIFRLNRIDGLKYKEIAELLFISVYTVQNHMIEAVKFISGYHTNIESD
ncbi:MAG: RNA polymerase sigma-70 factor [Bacteroidota bacterium]